MAKDKKEKLEECRSCKTYSGEDEHPCPYKEEINNDSKTLCNCCESCTKQCKMDI